MYIVQGDKILMDRGERDTYCLIGAGLLFTSRMMYSTLVYLTGAVPSEYYSAQKRPDYITYQQRTNRFFPGPPRK